MAKSFRLAVGAAFLLATALSSTPGAARVGAKCGGIAGLPCGAGEFCQHPTGACAVLDVLGSCVGVPQICNKIYQPVCGCDGHTYGNDCERMSAKVSKAHDGAC